MADGSIVFSTALDNSQLEQDMKETDKKVDDLKRKIEKKESDKNIVAEQMKQAQEEIERTEQKVIDLKNRLEELKVQAETDPSAMAEATAVAEELQAQVKVYEKQQRSAESLVDKWKKLDIESKQYTKDLESARAKQAALGNEYARSYKKGSSAFAASMANMDKRFGAFTAKVTKRIKGLFVFSFILGALASLKGELASTINENDRFAASIENLKAVIKGFAAPAVSLLANVLTSVVNVISTMLITLARMVDSIFHTNIVQSIQQSQQAAQASWNAADATDEQADATNRLSKAQKEAAKWIAAFDELNVKQAKDDSDVSDAMNDLADGGVAKPDWDALDVGKIDDTLAEIMLILGAALLAVGAILAFSGINIPLGLTLMAIGALMIYTAATEKWDQLPQEVRNAITTAITVTAVVLLVLGAVLAFSGVNIPLGIGLMCAGLVLLYTAASLNWDKLPEEVRTVITGALVIIGVVAVVIGAVLAFSGANIPLGIGLMIFGVMSLVGAAALNWDWLTGNIDTILGVLKDWLAPIGIVAVVLGVILLFAGVSAPVGIFLIAAGALAIAGSVALNWDWLTGNIDTILGVLKDWLGPVGIIAVVLGVILMATGVGVGVGAMLVFTGALLLVGAAALNWEWLTNNIDTVLGTLKDWLLPAGIIAVVLGVILLVTGVGIPVGLMLVILGAGAIVGSVALNWEWLTSNIDTVLGTLKQWLAPIGIIAVVLGVILCVTGVGIPVGLALIIAGAGAIVGSVALNWNTITSAVGGFVEDMKQYLFPAGMVAVVLGVILCVTGVGIPLGVALIALGAGSIVTAISCNFGGITDKIKGVWGDIKSWWGSSVAPIFTPQWWGNKFSSITKGLSQPLQSAGNAIHGFAVDMCKNIGAALSMMGQSWSYSVPYFNVPALAAGAVIPPNSEFLAVLGDQKRGRNIEAPEDLIRQIVRDETGDLASNLVMALMQVMPMMQQGKQDQGDVIMNVYLDGELIARSVNENNASMARRGLVKPVVSYG